MQAFDYNTRTAGSSSALAEWDFKSKSACTTLVIPDGCRDVIVRMHSDSENTCFVSDLSQSAYLVPSSPGTHMSGIRLQPSVQIQIDDLNLWLTTNDVNKLFESDQLDAFCINSNEVAEALSCLASDTSTVLCAANELGVSIRSLQRLLKSATGMSPSFWFSLARARKAARALFEYDNLSEAAHITGYCDQAHMSREMKRWFAQTPQQIKTNQEMCSLLSEAGYS